MSGSTATTGGLAGASFPQLVQMIMNPNGVPGTINAMRGQWDNLATIASNVAVEMDQELTALLANWQSAQAQPAFEQNVRPLIATIRSTGGTSSVIGGFLDTAELALIQAQSAMTPLIARYNVAVAEAAASPPGATAQLLEALRLQAVAIVQKLSDAYDSVATQISNLGMTAYSGPTAPGGTPANSANQGAVTTNGQVQVPNVPVAQQSAQQAATAASSTASTATSAATGVKIPTIPSAVTTPAGVTTPTLPTLGTTGTTLPTIPTIPTIPTVPTTVSTLPTQFAFPATGSLTPFGDTLLSGGGSDYYGSGTLGLVEASSATSLPSEALASGGIQSTGLPLEGTQAAAIGASDSGAMPFMPGMMGGAPPGSGAAGRTANRRLGEGLFDEELPEEAAARTGLTRAGIIEAEDYDTPVSAYGTASADPRGAQDRRRGRSLAPDDGIWALPGGLAPPILAGDPEQG
jgi:hypothetical protein